MSKDSSSVVSPGSLPVCSLERYAVLTGLSFHTVRGMVDKGHLPSVVIGRHRFVNVAELERRCLAGELS